MTTPTPVLLPAGFTWKDVADGCVLLAGGTRVLEVIRQNSGWVVQVDVPDDGSHSRRVVVGSRVAGVRFGNKWARAHKEMVARFDPEAGRRVSRGRRIRASDPETAAVVARPGDGTRSSAASAIGPEALRHELDEARALKEELNIHLDRIELIVEEMTR